MGITLSKIANNDAPVSFKYGDDEVNLRYYPGHVTEKIFAQLQLFGRMNEDNMLSQFESFNNILCRLIKSWDVYEDDAQTIMYPISPDKLADLPFAFRIACIQAIMRDIRPNEIAAKEI